MLDTLFGGYQIVRTGYAIGAPDSAYEDVPISREVDILLGLGFSALFITSAYYGYAVTGDCAGAQSPGKPPDESGDATASFRDRRVTSAPARPPAVRSELELGSWEVGLLGVPEATPDAVAFRIESRSRSQRFKGCTELQIATGGTSSRRTATYHADVAGAEIREVFVARLTVGELIDMTTSSWSSVGLCGQHQLISSTARTQIRSFVQRLAVRGVSRGAAAQPALSDSAPIVVTDVNLSLSLEGVAIDVFRQPSAFAGHAFVLLPGIRLQARECETLEIAIDGVMTSIPVKQRPGVDPAPFAALETTLVKRIAASSAATLGVCGHPHELSAPDRAALGALADDLKPPAPSPAAPAPSPAAPAPSPAAPAPSPAPLEPVTTAAPDP